MGVSVRSAMRSDEVGYMFTETHDHTCFPSRHYAGSVGAHSDHTGIINAFISKFNEHYVHNCFGIGGRCCDFCIAYKFRFFFKIPIHKLGVQYQPGFVILFPLSVDSSIVIEYNLPLPSYVRPSLLK